MEHIGQIVYFDKPGRANTERALALAKGRADELGLQTVLAATTTGETGVAVGRLFSGYRVVAVTHSSGFKGPDTQELEPQHRADMETAGVTILTATHVFGGVGRAVRRKLGTYELEELLAFAFRVFGEGMKVVLEITAMAADAGLVRCGEEALVIAGTGRGADTAAIVKPAHAQDFFDMRVIEILCKPRLGLA